VKREDVTVAAVAKERAAALPYIGGGLNPAFRPRIKFPKLLQRAVFFFI